MFYFLVRDDPSPVSAPSSAVSLSGSYVVPFSTISQVALNTPGETDWVNISNISVDDGNTAYVCANVDWGTAIYGFAAYGGKFLYGMLDKTAISANIPVSSEITGIQVITKIRDDIGTYNFSSDIYIIDNANTILWVAANQEDWPASSSTLIYGTSANNQGFTRSNLISTDYRLGFNINHNAEHNIHVDYLALKLYYDEIVPTTARSTGWTAPTSALSTLNGSNANQNWTNVTNVLSDNNVNATSGPYTFIQTSWYIHAKKFGFAIPSDATITGIEGRIRRYRSGGTSGNIVDNVVRVGVATIPFSEYVLTAGTNKANATNWGTTEVAVTYGGTTDLWGQTFTPSDINSENFTFALQVINPSFNFSGGRTAQVDYMELNIHYTEPE